MAEHVEGDIGGITITQEEGCLGGPLYKVCQGKTIVDAEDYHLVAWALEQFASRRFQALTGALTDIMVEGILRDEGITPTIDACKAYRLALR